MTLFLNPKYSDNDWLYWVSRNEGSFATLKRSELNYTLLLWAGLIPIKEMLNSVGREVYIMGFKPLVRTIGRSVYKTQNKNPVMVATWDLGPNNMGCTTPEQLFTWAADLFYCRYDKVRSEQFVLDVFKVFIGKFCEPGAHHFATKVHMVYPTLFSEGCKYENATLGIVTPLESEVAYLLTANMRPFLTDSTKITLFVETLVKLASTADYIDIATQWLAAYKRDFAKDRRTLAPALWANWAFRDQSAPLPALRSGETPQRALGPAPADNSTARQAQSSTQDAPRGLDSANVTDDPNQGLDPWTPSPWRQQMQSLTDSGDRHPPLINRLGPLAGTLPSDASGVIPPPTSRGIA